jgi:Domain of unknown function (DUF4326)
MPERIQRKRTKGWRKPPNTICATRISKTRPGKWGNPFTVEEYGREAAIQHYKDWLAKKDATELREYLAPLRGKNLACWCRLDEACHADVLLELANRDDAS